MRVIIFTGLPGTGKSTLAEQVARRIGWHEVGWDHVERMRTEIPPPTVDRLVVDAMSPLEDSQPIPALGRTSRPDGRVNVRIHPLDPW
jgi:2-phosphoglycerate kinase